MRRHVPWTVLVVAGVVMAAGCSRGARTAGVTPPAPSPLARFDSMALHGTVAEGDGELEMAPSATAQALVAAQCRSSRRPGVGAILGTVRSSTDDAPVPGVTVVGAWRRRDSTFAGSGVRPRARTRSDSTGHFVFCNVPRFTPVELWTEPVADEAAHVRVQLGARSIAEFDLSVAPRETPATTSDAPVRLGRLEGRIVTMTGDGLPNVTVSLDRPRLRRVTDTSGRFVMDSVPPGVRTLEVRAIGFQPQRLGVNVRPGERVEQDITLDRNTAVLGTYVVRASRTATWDSTGFEERRKRGAGHFFTSDMLTGVIDLATALRMVPGIRGRSNANSQRLVAGRGTGCFPAFVVNRVRFEAGGAIGPEALIRAQDIRAMEVYTSRLATPPEHQRYGDCAVIVIWLRNPQAEIEARRR